MPAVRLIRPLIVATLSIGMGRGTSTGRARAASFQRGPEVTGAARRRTPSSPGKAAGRECLESLSMSGMSGRRPLVVVIVVVSVAIARAV
jgi:hypothetical protein